MNQATLIADMNEAVHLLQTYQLSGLVWRFDECPLAEVKHYVPNGKEELVVISHKDDKFLPNRLVFDPGQYNLDTEDYRITLNFHPDYYIYIILNPEGKDD